MSLPHSYPFELPNISVYSSKLSRSGHDSIKNGLKSYLERIETGTLYITLTIEWIIENFASHDIKVSQTSECATIPKSSRLWIHSHHIYSKNKIESIKDWAEELNLSGFIMAGKPGLVCVEGSEENCQMWWQRVCNFKPVQIQVHNQYLILKVRSMNWQRITCKLQENAEGETVWRRFPEFTNITHKVTDMKAFLHFLESHNSHYVFKEFFGFDGK